MNKTSNIAKGGLYTALTVILIYLSSMLPTNKLAIIAVASCIIPLSIITTNIKNSFAVYLSVSILSLLLGLKGSALAYILFFGLYGFVKYYVEAKRKPVLEFAIKFLFFNCSMTLAYFLFKLFAFDIPIKKFPIYLIIIALQIIFIIYDYALTLMIGFINSKLSHSKYINK